MKLDSESAGSKIKAHKTMHPGKMEFDSIKICKNPPRISKTFFKTTNNLRISQETLAISGKP